MLQASCHVAAQLTNWPHFELQYDDWNKNKSIFIKTLAICASIIATISLVNWMFSSARMVSMLMCGLLLKVRSSSEDWYSRQASSLAFSSDIFEPLGGRLPPHNLNDYTNNRCYSPLKHLYFLFVSSVRRGVPPLVVSFLSQKCRSCSALQNVRRVSTETTRHRKRYVVHGILIGYPETPRLIGRLRLCTKCHWSKAE